MLLNKDVTVLKRQVVCNALSLSSQFSSLYFRTFVFNESATTDMTTLTFQQRCLLFGARIYTLLVNIRRTPASRDILDQLIRSGTSIGANANEARGAESRADFIHKMGIALKEARETAYWLSFIEQTEIVKDASIANLKAECNELISILVKSVTTAKRNTGVVNAKKN